MSSKALVVGTMEKPETENGPAPHIHLKNWQQPDGNMAMPFFTTINSLRRNFGEEEPYLEIPVLELFQRTRGTTLVLTGEGSSKVFKPEEVDVLLSSIMAMDPLALSLIRAIKENNEEGRNSFYQLLINSHVFVLGHPANEGTVSDKIHTMGDNDQFVLASCKHPSKNDGSKVIPFFSSLTHLSRVSPKDGKYLSFQALTFLSMAKPIGLPLVLNLGSTPHKFFTPDEVDFLLGATAKDPFENRKFSPGTKIFMTPPKVYPQELVGSLLDLLPNHPAVKTAYLTTLREGTEDAPPVLVIGFEADGDLRPMFRVASPLMAQYGEEGVAIDFIELKPGEDTISDYFMEKVRPFYHRPLPDVNAKPQPEPTPDKPLSQPEQLDKPGFLGRLKKVFSG